MLTNGRRAGISNRPRPMISPCTRTLAPTPRAEAIFGLAQTGAWAGGRRRCSTNSACSRSAAVANWPAAGGTPGESGLGGMALMHESSHAHGGGVC